MAKLFLSLIIIVCATLLGNSFSMRLSARRNTLIGIISALSRMKTQICFGAVETHRIVEECFCSREFPLISSECISSELSIKEALTGGIMQVSSGFALTKADKELLLKFSAELGTTDITGQIAHVELYTQLFSERLDSVKKQVSEKSKLYRVLGFSVGSAISLMIA